MEKTRIVPWSLQIKGSRSGNGRSMSGSMTSLWTRARRRRAGWQRTTTVASSKPVTSEGYVGLWVTEAGRQSPAEVPHRWTSAGAGKTKRGRRQLAGCLFRHRKRRSSVASNSRLGVFRTRDRAGEGSCAPRGKRRRVSLHVVWERMNRYGRGGGGGRRWTRWGDTVSAKT
jgi:hypothetical protein